MGRTCQRSTSSSYYRCVAYIPQEPPIFDGTLRENLLFDRPVDTAVLNEIVRQVGLDELVAPAAQRIGDHRRRTRDQAVRRRKQRLSFGRVLLQDPKIIILDEPTSALDSLTEDFITHNLLAILKGKTVIVVAHRLQTVRSADQILVMEEGQVVQAGTFTQLLSQSGKFYQLWQKQTREEDPEAAGTACRIDQWGWRTTIPAD